MAIATLGGGCFWCLDAVFRRLQGVDRVISGYAGGQSQAPDYESVCSGLTGHAEVVQIHYDEAVIPYRILLDVFFAIHDPTTLNRQGNDVGTQYRSVIFYSDDSQRDIAQAILAELAASGRFAAPLVTECLPLPVFYPAEEYHQDYFARHPGQGYCQFVVAPKVGKAQRSFQQWLKPDSEN